MTKTLKTEDLIAANTAAIAHMQSVANTALAAVESLAALNLGFARESLSNTTKRTCYPVRQKPAGACCAASRSSQAER